MKEKQENHKLAPDPHVLRSQVVADLGHLMARWWLDRRDKDGHELCKDNVSVRPTK